MYLKLLTVTNIPQVDITDKLLTASYIHVEHQKIG